MNVYVISLIDMFIVHRYLIISGTAKWHIDDQVFEAEAGKLIHHPPGAGHRFVTSDLPLLAIWIRTGKIEGKYSPHTFCGTT